MDSDSEFGVPEFWHKFNVALPHVKAAWDSVSKSTTNAGWEKLWPSVVNFTRFPSVESQVEETVQLAKKLPGEGSENMQPELFNDKKGRKKSSEKFGRAEFPDR